MLPGCEYRVFVPPMSNGEQAISAISQYRWFERWVHGDKDEQEKQETATRITEGAERIFEQILKSKGLNDRMKE